MLAEQGDSSQLLVAEAVRNCTCVEDGGEMGRVLVATVSFVEGDLVLEESPLLTWQDDPMSLFRDFLASSSWKQTVILDMAQSEVSAERAAEHEQVALFASQSDLAIPVATARQLLVIVDVNAHQIQSAVSHGAHAGLFARASKVEHSCDPNCAKTTQASPGVIRYYANRTIDVGERISVSYLPDLWSTPRASRRAALLTQEKAFCCKCSRCVGTGDCRGLKCLNDKCDGFSLQVSSSSEWHCRMCDWTRDGMAMEPRLLDERKFLARGAEMQSRAAGGTLSPSQQESLRAEIVQLLGEIHLQLSPTHFFGISLLETLHTEEYFPYAGKVAAAQAYVQKLKILDCVAAGCCTAVCPGNHPAHADNWADADAAVQFCLVAGLSMQKDAVRILGEHLPWIQKLAPPGSASELQELLATYFGREARLHSCQ